MKVVEKKGRKLNVNGILVAMTCILVLVLVLENLYFFVFRKPEEFKVYDVRESYFKYDEERVPELKKMAMAGMIYNLVCLLILFSVLLMFATEAVANMMYERWHRVGVFLSKYPKRKKGEGDKRRVLVTDCEGNVGEAQYDFRTYTFSIEKVRAWKNYPEPFRVSKGPVRKIRELRDERLAKKIRKEVKKWHTE